jgi:predicted NBD/HSP70 family sugar kinase
VKVVAGVDLGGTAINYTFLDQQGQFRIEGLCEHPARSVEGPDICLGQIADGLARAAEQAGLRVENVVAIGLDTPGPASSTGVLSRRGSTNFVHADWAGYDIRAGLEARLGAEFPGRHRAAHRRRRGDARPVDDEHEVTPDGDLSHQHRAPP